MSQENVEVVRRSWEALERGGLDAAAEFWDSDIEWRAVEGALDDVGVFSGRDAMRRYYADWLSMFDELRGEVEAVIFQAPHQVGAGIPYTRRRSGNRALGHGP